MRIRTPSVRAGLDEAGRGDRLPRRGRVAEAEAAHGAGVLALELGSSGSSSSASASPSSSSGSSSCSASGSAAAVAVAVGVGRGLLVERDQLRQHPGERVHLVAAQLRPGRELRRLLAEHALEPEHEAAVALPARRRRRRARASISASASSSAGGAPSRARGTSAGSSLGRRNGSPAQPSARWAASARASSASGVIVDCSVVACIAAAPGGAAVPTEEMRRSRR